MVDELEAKYLLRGDHARPKKRQKVLRRLLEELFWAGYVVVPRGGVVYHDTYYDSDEGHLQQAGWSLRARTGSGIVMFTCKQIGLGQSGLFERREIEQRSFNDEWDINDLGSGEVAGLLHCVLPAHERVIPLFQLSNDRTRYRLSHPDYPRTQIDLSMDVVRIKTETALDFTEFECELVSGPVRALVPAMGVLRQQPGLYRARVSKYQRGLQASDSQVANVQSQLDLPSSPQADWASLGLLRLQAQAQQLKVYEPLAWEGLHPEGVHRMRVATRRASAAIKLFDDVLAPAEASALFDDVRWLGRILGNVRDLDVHLAHVSGYQNCLKRKEFSVLRVYHRKLQSNRQIAHATLLQALESDRYRGLSGSFRALRDAPLRSTVPQRTIAEAVRVYTAPQLRSVRQRGRKINSRSPPGAYHRLRIELKHLRYQLECLAAPYGKNLRTVNRKLQRLLQTLGDHQDACIAQTRLTTYHDRQKLATAEKRVVRKLLLLEKGNAQQHRKQFFKDWRKFDQAVRALKVKALKKPRVS